MKSMQAVISQANWLSLCLSTTRITIFLQFSDEMMSYGLCLRDKLCVLCTQHSPFFAEQLTAFQVWLTMGVENRNPPEQLPIVLQVNTCMHTPSLRVKMLQFSCILHTLVTVYTLLFTWLKCLFRQIYLLVRSASSCWSCTLFLTKLFNHSFLIIQYENITTLGTWGTVDGSQWQWNRNAWWQKLLSSQSLCCPQNLAGTLWKVAEHNVSPKQLKSWHALSSKDEKNIIHSKL